MDYDPATYWSGVARRARERMRGAEVAGDDSPYYRYKRHLFLKQFLSMVPIEGRSALEIGCGPGGNLRELARRGPARLVGCDVAPGMVDLAQEAVEGMGVEVTLIDGSTLPFADREFDIALTVTVLMHNPSSRVAQLAEQMARVTKSSIFVIEDTVSASTSDDVGVGDYGQVFPRTLGALAGFYVPHGFELVKTERLRTYVSQRANRFFLRLKRKGEHEEGEPYSRAQWIVGQVTLPITRVFDKVVTSPDNELTMLHFQRS
jgi:SAM-dependent methyltransferase